MYDVTTTNPKESSARIEERELSLVAISGPGEVFTVALDDRLPSRALVGQSPTCEIRIADAAVSRRHAALDIAATHVTITDLGSKNGTFVNGVAVMAARLHGGEVIRVGDTKLRVLVGERRRASPTFDRGEASFGAVVGGSVEMRRVFAIARRLAATDHPVLLEGEPGTGKRLLAEAIHEKSARRAGPFIVLETSGIDPARIASALFGSGREELGVLEHADSGTLVIEEITALDPASQTRLRRALEHAEIRRKNGAASALDVRVIACTRKDLDREVEAGRFREDLFLLLAGGRVEAPPLRRRSGDLPLLVEALWTSLGGEPDAAPHHLLESYAEYTWPGNVRELENVLVRWLVGEEAPRSSSLRDPIDSIDAVLDLDLPLPRARERLVREFEQRYLSRALAKHDGNVLRAAAASGVARRYFQLLRTRQMRGG